MPFDDARWFRADIGYACFGFAARNGTVVEAAPIAKWMVGQDLDRVLLWIAKRGRVWDLSVIR